MVEAKLGTPPRLRANMMTVAQRFFFSGPFFKLFLASGGSCVSPVLVYKLYSLVPPTDHGGRHPCPSFRDHG